MRDSDDKPLFILVRILGFAALAVTAAWLCEPDRATRQGACGDQLMELLDLDDCAAP